MGFRRLVRAHGSRAPGPHPDLWLQPDPQRLVAVPSWDWLRFRVDPARSRAVVAAARVAGSLERLTGLPHPEADRRMRSVPGIGVWTSAETRVRAHGDPDAVSFGDYHVAADIGWALTGEPVDDAGLAVLLREWAGHRYGCRGCSGWRAPIVPVEGRECRHAVIYLVEQMSNNDTNGLRVSAAS